MAALPDAVFIAAEKLGVVVYRAHRSDVREWNEDRGDHDLRHFCGHYWFLKQRGQGNRVPVTAQFGPFMSESAALRDAVTQLEKLAKDDPRIARVLRENALISASVARKLIGEKRPYAA